MGLFGKSKAEREKDQREREEYQAQVAKEAARQEAEYQQLVQAVARLKQLEPKWRVSCSELDFRRNTKTNLVNFSASSKLRDGISVEVHTTSSDRGGRILTHASLKIEQAKTDTLDAFRIYSGDFQNYSVGVYESNVNATEYLVAYIRTVAGPLIDASNLKDKETQERQKRAANDFWNK